MNNVMNNVWVKFAIRYFSVLILGTMAISFGSRFLRKMLIEQQLSNAMSSAVTAHSAGTVKPGTDDQPEISAALWGIVKKPSLKAYRTAGPALGGILAGTPVDISKTILVTDESYAVCAFEHRGQTYSNMLIKTKELKMLPGSLKEMDPERVKLLGRKMDLELKIAEAKLRTGKVEPGENPYEQEYSEVKEEHDSYWKKVNDLKDKAAKSSSADRIKHLDALRELKGQDIEISRKMSAIKKKYENWNAENDPSSPLSKTGGLQAELDRINAKLTEKQQE